jgi:hypothetical protein
LNTLFSSLGIKERHFLGFFFELKLELKVFKQEAYSFLSKGGIERMTTPNKKAIIEKAIELFHNERCKNGDPAFAISPTEQELAENGFIQTAKSTLMMDQYRSEIEGKNYTENLEDFAFDVELGLKEGTFVSGGRGCGKSSLTKTIVDMFFEHGYVVRIFDNSQSWRRSSIANLVIIKPYSNFQPQYNESYVFDISLLSLEQQKRFIENIVDNDFNYTASLNENERNWRIYVFEEAELLIGTHDQSKPILKLVASGRNFNLSFVVVAQRFAMISTNLISLCGQLYLGTMHEQNDLKKAHNWLGKNVKELAKLDVGKFLRYSKGSITKMATELFTTETKSNLIDVESKSIIPQPIKRKEEISVMPFLKLAMIALFTILLLGVRR